METNIDTINNLRNILLGNDITFLIFDSRSKTKLVDVLDSIRFYHEINDVMEWLGYDLDTFFAIFDKKVSKGRVFGLYNNNQSFEIWFI